MLALALVVSLGVNGIALLTILKFQRKVSLIMTANKDALDALQTDAANESSVVDAAIVLINGMSNRLTDILTQTPPEDLTAEIQALRDEINQRAVALGQAVAAGTAAENDSSNFPTSGTSGGTTTGDTSGTSTGGTSSDTSGTSQDGGDTAPPTDNGSTDATTPVAPAGDGTADVAPPSAGDNLEVTPDSPPAVETPGDEAVAPETGTALPDEDNTTPAP